MKRAARLLSTALAGLAALTALYFLAAWLGSSLPRGGASPPGDDVTIMVETNGVHTGIVMPIVTPELDWRTVFPGLEQPVNGEVPTHIAIGWGEREVFLHVPTWSDLSPLTALRIATVGGESVLRVTPYVRPAPSPDMRPLRLASANYRRMVQAILASLDEPPPEGHVALRGSFAAADYYPSPARYTLLTTCNSWVGDRLADGGVAMGGWTPLAGGVMKWVPYAAQ